MNRYIQSTNPIHLIEVEIRGEIKGGYRLKVVVLDIGLFIDGWRLLKPVDGREWWLQPPAHRVGQSWIIPAEFDKSKSLWQDIYQKALEAVNLYESSSDRLMEEDLSEQAIAKSLDEAVKAIGNSSPTTPGKAVSWLND